MRSPAHCHGRQVCQITEVVNSFGEPCPQLGSYLSLDYHCKDGWFTYYYNALRYSLLFMNSSNLDIGIRTMQAEDMQVLLFPIPLFTANTYNSLQYKNKHTYCGN